MSEKHTALLDWLLKQGKRVKPDPVESLREWKKIHDNNSKSWEEPIDRAISSGFLADRTAYAFVAGFRSALQRLFPLQPIEKLTAFCISEEGGNHPKFIKSSLEKTNVTSGDEVIWKLNGRKKFITCASIADSLYVAASTGIDEKGRNRIKLVLLDRDSEGIEITPMENLPFIPEINHGIVELKDVVVKDSQIMPGDAYSRYVKPFRLIEDIHVNASLMGYLFRIACLFSWPREVREKLLAIIGGIRVVAMADPESPDIHIVFSGTQRIVDQLIQEIVPLWDETTEEIRDHWNRDIAIMTIGEKARIIRPAAAWKQYE